MLTLSKIASVLTPVVNKARLAYLSTKNAWCYTDENAAQWWLGKQRAVLTADLSASTSTTLADVTGLGFPVLANTRYGFKFRLIYNSAATTTGLKLGLTAPSGFNILSADVSIFGRAVDGAGTAAWFGTLTNVAASDSVISDAVESTAGNYIATVEGVLVNGSTGGTLQLQWATEVAASGVVAKQGSNAELWLL